MLCMMRHRQPTNRALPTERHSAPALWPERALPRYFFNVRDGEAYPDLQGTELADLNAARDEAIRFSGALLKEGPEKFWGPKGWEMEVCDDFGLRLFVLRFSAEEAPQTAAVPYVERTDPT